LTTDNKLVPKPQPDKFQFYDLKFIETNMRPLSRCIVLFTIVISLISCSTTVRLIDKSKTQYGDIKFYSERISKNNSSIKRIYASVKTGESQSYYSFYPDKIVKTTDKAKALNYTVSYEQLQTSYDTTIYQKFSVMDSIVLSKGHKLLGSLGLNYFKTSKGATAFMIEVNYYHGFPKGKRFRP
jgi:hypothetical protein